MGFSGRYSIRFEAAHSLKLYVRGFQEVMNTPLVLPPLEMEIYGAKPNILSL
jgi:hypothetical protein